MSYICLECGKTFGDGLLTNRLVDSGEHWGHPYTKYTECCPSCGGECEEAVPCELCGNLHLEDDLNGGICDDCLDMFRHDALMCYKIGKKDTDAVQINCFLSTVFSEEEINEILWAELKNRVNNVTVDCSMFIDSDRDWFATQILDELRLR